jgi:hypothetical protein
MSWIQVHALELASEGLKVLTIVAGTLTVVWQIAKQHRNSLALQRQNAREALNLRIYENLVQRLRSHSDASSAVAMYAFGIPSAIQSLQQQQTLGMPLVPLRQRTNEFADLHFRAEAHFPELLMDLESWSIAIPGVNVFQVALNAAAYDVRTAFVPLHTALISILPMDPPVGHPEVHTIVQPLPSPEVLSNVQVLIDKYSDARQDLGSYLHDLMIAAQNNLLQNMFDGRVAPERKPLDPRHKVITLDPARAEALIRHFETETPWGKNQAVINAEVLEQIKRRIVDANRV